MQKEIVSIVIPVYNAEKFIKETIECIEKQTYPYYEILLIDDGSKDRSEEIIVACMEKNSKIKYYKNEKNVGAALTRNHGIEKATGRYITFLDADDLWNIEKLEKQVHFMGEKNCAFSYTGYEFADEKGVGTGKKVFVPDVLSYKDALKNTTISTITVMFDMKKITKEDIYMPNIASEDTATWWRILKKGYYAYGLNEILSIYRRSVGTLSSNKMVAIQRIWNLYRLQNFSILKSSYYMVYWALNAVRRRV